MTITEKSIVGEIVADNYKTASIFKSNNIDFCCKGNRSIAEVCEKQEINTKELIDSLIESANTTDSGSSDFNSWSLDLLIDYIEKKHHAYVEQKIQEIIPFLTKVTTVHGGRHPELHEINKLFTEASQELTQHMKKEELILFPFIKQLENAKKNNQTAENPHFGTVENPIEMMKYEHDTEGERFRKIAQLTDNYTPPQDACTTYKVTFLMLQEFEEDLHHHIHLENNILFPKAIELEKKVVNA
ncbi:MAG: iron-sulfur cluster repair di-iron protein [Flavobacteriales bacterium]|nr:iron-sulfur cluster repair di-iron protein [Flavobacteriales bacterium]